MSIQKVENIEREVRQLERDVAEIKKLVVSPESCPSPRKQRLKVEPCCCGPRRRLVGGAT